MSLKFYLVSASHIVAEYALAKGVVDVKRDGAGFYASKSPYGCGKTKSTVYDAIRSLLGENGCTNIVMHGECDKDGKRVCPKEVADYPQIDGFPFRAWVRTRFFSGTFNFATEAEAWTYLSTQWERCAGSGEDADYSAKDAQGRYLDFMNTVTSGVQSADGWTCFDDYQGQAKPLGVDDIDFGADKAACRAAQATEFRKILTVMRVDHSGLSDADCRDLYNRMVRTSQEIAAKAGYFEGEI